MPRSRRGRKRKIKLKISPASVTSMLSILLLLAGGLSIISFFTPGHSLNGRLLDMLKGTFGWAAFIAPLIMIVWGLLLIKSLKLKYVQLRVLFGLIGLILGLAGLLHVFYSGDRALELAQQGVGGGVIGYQIALMLRNTVGVIGAFIILLALNAIAIIFILDVPFDEVVVKLKAFITKLTGFKFKEKLPLMNKGSENESAVTQEVVDSSIKISGADGDMLITSSTKLEKLPEPSFEVIPSMSEPQSEKTKPLTDPNAGLVSLAPNLPYSDRIWELPPIDLLDDPPNKPIDRGDVQARAKVIEQTLESFGISAKVVEVNYGPTVTRYALEAEVGTKITKIASHQYDLALALASPTGSVRIEAPIPGKSLIGVEVPNSTRQEVTFKEVFTSDAMKNVKSKLGIVLGKDVGGQPMIYDIAKMPHLLVAGATGSGKSIFLHSIMFSLLFRCTPDECKLILIDPKRVELVNYQDIPHLYSPVVTDIDRASAVFKWAVVEMERRYKLFESAKARNIESYNEKSGFQALPYIVIVVDELGEIMVADPASVEKSIIRLAQLARATGIHLILTTQRPSTNVVTGLIKANIPCRIAFNVTSNTDSRVIIDMPGAEKLMGKGDMLFVPPDASKAVRIQGTWAKDSETSRLVNYLKGFGVTPDYKEEITSAPQSEKSIVAGGEVTDNLFDEALQVVVEAKKASASLLQRRLSVGYARAARILDELEAAGIVGPAQGSKARDVYPPHEQQQPGPTAPSLSP